MTERAKTNVKRGRIHWMDNLRTIIIFMVVFYHVGGVYESAGLWGWFWIIDDPDTLTWVGIVGIIFDLFMMPTMFFIAGYLTPPSLDKKSGWEFVKGKFTRLMVPWLIAVFTLISLYRVIFLYSRWLPQENWHNYIYFIDPNSQKWLWFLPLLFVFNLIYLAVNKLGSFRLYVTGTGKLWEVLNRDLYGVYIIHVILIGIFGTLLLFANLPEVVKWLLLITSTYVGSNLLVSLNRRGVQALRSSRNQSISQFGDAG